jgi:hypothetical protein
MMRRFLCVLLCTGAFLLLGVSGLPKAAESLFDGEDWVRIDSYRLPQMERLWVKRLMIQAVVETIWAFKPHSLPRFVVQDCVYLTDRLYRNKDYRDIPLFFALPLIEMIRYKTPDSYIDVYIRFVRTRLKQ